jgi:hypothetical protein
MKAITLWQPYASLVGVLKFNETRSWGTRYRGPLAIHAAARAPFMPWVQGSSVHEEEMATLTGALRELGVSSIFELPRGAVVSKCRLVDCIEITYKNFDAVVPKAPDRHYGDYRVGRFIWVLRDIVRLPRPVPARGKQGFWEWDDTPIRPPADRRQAALW